MGDNLADLAYLAPTGLEEAAALLQGEGALPLAGGTDLVIAIKRGEVKPRLVVDVTSIPEMREIGKERIADREFTVIGAAVTFSRLSSSAWIIDRARALAQAAAAVGSPQIRNRGTVGGNIANGSPAADVATALVALESRLRVIGQGGRREIDLAEALQTPPGKTGLGPGDLIYQVVFPTPPAGACSAFVKLGRRNALAVARISVAILFALGDESRITRAAVSLGAVAPHPFRVRSAETVLLGKKLETGGVGGAVVAAIAAEAAATLDKRASADYKREAVKGVAWDALEACLR